MYESVICEIDRAERSLIISGSTKKLTGISTDSPGFKVCSVKQKHSILLKYAPAASGATLNVAVPVTGLSEVLVAR